MLQLSNGIELSSLASIKKMKVKPIWSERIFLYGTNNMTYLEDLSGIIKKKLTYDF